MTVAGDDMARAIGRDVPLLRRFARALTGTQAEGDALVRACLDRLLQEPQLLDPEQPRVALFRALHQVLGRLPTTDPTLSVEVVANEAIIGERLRQLPPLSRWLLLLTMLEGFSVEEVGIILGIGAAEAEARLHAAREELKAQAPSRVLVIEDQPVIAFDIISTVTGVGHSVVGVARTRDEAVRLAATARPDVILADLQLADQSSGLEAVEEIVRARPVPVIFITAYPDELLTGDRGEPTYLITKPFQADTLIVSVAQVLAHARPEQAPA
jgi:CheY-like chemotaxis protein/DNA-directed RNA polymerase specialized sigma24 family protein